MNYNKELLDEVYELYSSEKIGYCPICEQCKGRSQEKGIKLINGPVPIFHIGKDYEKSEKRLLIVGMVAYGWQDIISDFNKSWSEVFDGNRKTINEMQEAMENRVFELFNNGKIKYYNYIKFALTDIYGNSEAAFDCVAFTNFVHCNNGGIRDILPQIVREYCSDFSKNGFIHKEIELLKPTHIIGLSNDWKYTRYMSNSKWKYKGILHPSSRGRKKIEFRNDIVEFLNE